MERRRPWLHGRAAAKRRMNAPAKRTSTGDALVALRFISATTREVRQKCLERPAATLCIEGRRDARRYRVRCRRGLLRGFGGLGRVVAEINLGATGCVADRRYVHFGVSFYLRMAAARPCTYGGLRSL